KAIGSRNTSPTGRIGFPTSVAACGSGRRTSSRWSGPSSKAEHLFPVRGRSEPVDRRAFLRTMRVLEARYPIQDWAQTMTPFEVLISTVLSQSTTVANERRGFEALRARAGHVTADRLAAVSEGDIARPIWHAGLAPQKDPRRGASGVAGRARRAGSQHRVVVCAP